MNAKRFLVVIIAIFCLFTTDAYAKTYSSVVVYGDSLSDNGNFFNATGQPGFPYYDGRRCDGPVAVEYLASFLGAPLIDFAWIGATTGVGNYADSGNVTEFGAYNLPGMTTMYGATKGLLGPYMSGGLFVVWGGPNDILAPSPMDGNDISAIVSRALANELAIIGELKEMGAETILAPGMPDLGLTPYFNSVSPEYAALGTAITNAFNAGLEAMLPSDVLYYDTAALMRSVVNNPSAHGFTNVTDACFDGSAVCGDPGTYLFFDDFHPTTATHEILGRDFAATVVPLPSAIIFICTGFGFLAVLRRHL